MKYLKTLILIFIIFSQNSFAQKIELINSGELLTKASTLYDSSQYKDALLLLDKVNRSDTNYVWALYQKALNCEADSQYNKSINYCREAMSLKEQREYEPDIYNTWGNTLTDMGKPEEALKVFDAAIAKYPAFSLFYFNKGIAYNAMDRLADAEACFEKTLLVNPYMYSAHYWLATAAARQGKIMPAFLSFVGYLLVNPEGKYANKCVKALDAIARSTDEVIDIKNKRTVQPDAVYQEIEDIVLARLALDPGYKPIIKLDDAISRQIQVVFEKLEYKEDSNDFWIQYYLPYFKQIYSKGEFEPFIYHIFSNVQIPVIQDYNKKNKKLLDNFVNEAADYFNMVRSTRELNYKKRGSITEQYLFDDGKLAGFGTLANNGKILTGKWTGYYKAGNIRDAGNYNAAGQREGEWTFYFFTGAVKAKEKYVAGKLEGKQEYYYDNGNPSSVENNTGDKLDGPYVTYYYAGNIKSSGSYKLGKKEGEAKEYYSNGNLQSLSNYTNGVLSGPGREYYKSGGIKKVGQYVNGKNEGPYKSYYESGALSSEGQFSKDNADGEWKYYYENGKVKETYSYVNGFEEGLHQEYYENGQISAAYPAKKAKINGESTHYYKDGKVFSKYVYDNGVIKSAKYINLDGTEVNVAEFKGDSAGITSYTTHGAKKAHYFYNKKGNLDGPDTIFYPSGKIKEINHYKDGDFNGPAITYFLSGDKKTEANFVNGKDDGYFTSFYVNGKVESEGWMRDDEKQGEWKYYDEKGRLSTKTYYQDGELSGYNDQYLPTGKLSIEQKYTGGWVERLTQYDSTGKAFHVDSFPKLSGKYTLIYPNGKPMIEADYVNGDFNGWYKTFYFDGSPVGSTWYNKGVQDSVFVDYYYGGTKYREGHYKNGGKTGLWKMYNEDGKLYSTGNYVNDELNGEKIYYFEDGTKDYVGTYKDDDLNGPASKYDPDGTLAYQLFFEDDDPIGYSYLGKDGKPVAMIPIGPAEGSVKAYFPNGKVSRECSYVSGEKNGQEMIYYTNGQVRSVDTDTFGSLQGISKEFYPDGKIKSEYHYVNDNSNDICREYDKNGILKKEMVFEDGVSHGPVKYYKDGKLVKTMWYYYGELRSVKNE